MLFVGVLPHPLSLDHDRRSRFEHAVLRNMTVKPEEGFYIWLMDQELRITQRERTVAPSRLRADSDQNL